MDNGEEGFDVVLLELAWLLGESEGEAATGGGTFTLAVELKRIAL
jgi:hypothetical protein